MARFFFKSSESDDSLTIFSLDPTRLKTKHWCADLWRTMRPSVSSTVCLVHGAIRFFVISCSANIYRPFLNWRIWEMYIDKHYFHLKQYSIMQLLYADTSPAYQNCRIEYSFRWKCAVFFNEVGNKKEENMGNKKKKITQIVAVAYFLIFQMQILRNF